MVHGKNSAHNISEVLWIFSTICTDEAFANDIIEVETVSVTCKYEGAVPAATARAARSH